MVSKRYLEEGGREVVQRLFEHIRKGEVGERERKRGDCLVEAEAKGKVSEGEGEVIHWAVKS